jgi:Na+-transporting methylmalonyl-CoA/oxaloacetate decarboxylase gamma subunit
MSNWAFGWTMLIVGMGGTLVVLGLFALIMSFLKKLFPFKEEHNN